MPLLLIYILKLSLSLAIVYLFYQLVLRKLTFYNSNRWYLVGYTFLSFLIPFINISPVLEKNSFSEHGLVQLIPTMEKYTSAMLNESTDPTTVMINSWGRLEWLLVAMLTGAFVFFLRFMIQCISYFNMRRKAQRFTVHGMNLYQVNKNIIPFSFGNSVFINSDLHTEEELREIIRHEFVHVKQKHTLDIIWSEWLCIISWYNPFAWLLKKAIRQNLEFIADNEVLENGVNRKQYQYLLLKVIGNNHFSIAQKFNFSSLKKRIAMMNKLRSAKLHLARFLFILPLLAVILISFRKQKQVPDKAQVVQPVITLARDTVPDVTEPNDKGYIINVIDDNGNCILVIKDKSGKQVDRLLLTKWNENESYYQEKYGKIPPPPPPVPPLPPGSPVPPRLPSNVKSMQYKYDEVEVWLKDGKKESYDLKVPAEKKAYEKRYGVIVPAPEAPVLPAGPPAHPAPLKTGAPATPTAPAAPVKSIGIMKTEPGVISPVAIVDQAQGRTVVAPTVSAEASGPGIPTIDPIGNTFTGEEEVLVTITRKTTPQQLEEYKRKMKEKGIELKFDNADYNEGILVSVRGSIRSEDHRGNFSATDFNKLILSTIKEGERIYFKVEIIEKRVVI